MNITIKSTLPLSLVALIACGTSSGSAQRGNGDGGGTQAGPGLPDADSGALGSPVDAASVDGVAVPTNNASDTGSADGDTVPTDGILTNFTGSISGTAGTFSSSSFSHGFATHDTDAAGTRTLMVFFTSYSNACQYAQAGGFLQGGQTFAMQVTLEGHDIASMTEYAAGTALAVQSAPIEWMVGVNCVGSADSGADVPPAQVSSASVSGEMIVYSFDPSRVTGRFHLLSSGSAIPVDGTFDVPICNFPPSSADAGPSRDICLPAAANAPTNAVSSPCGGGSPPTIAGGTLTGVTGNRSGPAGAFPTSTFNTGFASIEAIENYPSSFFTTLYLEFADYGNSCGYEAAGAAMAGGHLFAVWALQSSTTASPTFAAGTYTDVFSDVYPESNQAAADKECMSAAPPSVHGTSDSVAVSAIDAAHVAGSFQLQATGDAGAVSGTFDLPLCNPPAYDGGAPQACCL